MRFRKKLRGLKIIFLLIPPYNSPLQRNPFGFFDFLNYLKFQPTLLNRERNKQWVEACNYTAVFLVLARSLSLGKPNSGKSVGLSKRWA